MARANGYGWEGRFLSFMNGSKEHGEDWQRPGQITVRTEILRIIDVSSQKQDLAILLTSVTFLEAGKPVML